MRSRLRLVTLLVTAAVALAFTSGQAQQTANVESLALQDTAKLRRKGPRAIPNRYIVVLDQDAAGPAGNPAIAAKLTEDVLAAFGREADHLYSKALNGFSVELTEAEAVAISEDPRVAFVEEDSVMETQITQTNPPWGLERLPTGKRSGWNCLGLCRTRVGAGRSDDGCHPGPSIDPTEVDETRE